MQSDYVTGTITLTAGSANFTGTGTGWATAGFQAGDTIFDITGATQYTGVIATITAAGAGTLTKNWEGPTLSNVPYRMRYQPDGSRVTAQARALIELLGNGNLASVAGLNWAGGIQVVGFNGAGSAILLNTSDLTSGAFYNVQVANLVSRSAYDAQPGPTGTTPGFAVLVSDVGDGRAAIYSKKSDTSGDWSTPAYITGQPRFDIIVDDPGIPGAGEILMKAVLTVPVQFALNLSGSLVSVEVNPTGTAVYSLTKNNVQFATISIASTGVATMVSAITNFVVGDILRVVAPNPRNATLAGVSMTLAATR